MIRIVSFPFCPDPAGPDRYTSGLVRLDRAPKMC